jgi:hypothetical protein
MTLAVTPLTLARSQLPFSLPPVDLDKRLSMNPRSAYGTGCCFQAAFSLFSDNLHDSLLLLFLRSRRGDS